MKNKDDFQVNTVLNIFRASNLLSRIGGKLTVKVGLTSVQQWILLGAISKQEGLSLKELREDTLVTKQNISSMVDRLRQAGYVTTYEDLSDRRITRVKLTEQGKLILEALKPLTNVSNDRTFEVFEPEELVLFASLIERLVTHLNQQVDRPE
ncbi:MarR family winged helix-turn-helix transcriptional regulator [Priestia megaterium]|uniref:MarR family winged helix-turn-helix transcriptional regulator n=1 Tax=Priestia megaterium TaxID=1404 RepID=UPI0013B5C1FF|nr:MarR family winged helix-turn-helix transcriptional regulator [Priestia megaterium]NER40271.1 winged helix-turn-helix transcriptional regulator [Priestia megaterium NBRC 15308 = ATCC 14581]MBU8589275.1 MarR family winged helix-turn-helix transcriptional regulator [Priestia megaterium]MED4134060.1 MarR family winged helix-turn-helix transcriptional regulator [Priestia megaterium]NGY80588.1 winged helix-turn-helix transcriptional regulator [Priestia megaterium]NGY80694.1 winged helix-turn-hel